MDHDGWRLIRAWVHGAREYRRHQYLERFIGNDIRLRSATLNTMNRRIECSLTTNWCARYRAQKHMAAGVGLHGGEHSRLMYSGIPSIDYLLATRYSYTDHLTKVGTMRESEMSCVCCLLSAVRTSELQTPNAMHAERNAIECAACCWRRWRKEKRL